MSFENWISWFKSLLQGADSRPQEAEGATRRIEVGDIQDVSGQVNVAAGDIYQIYQAPAGQPKLSQAEFERILDKYLHWVVNAYSKARLYGLESLHTTHGQPAVRQLADVFVPLSLRRLRPPSRAEIEADLPPDAAPLDRARAFLKLVEERRSQGEQVQLDELLLAGPRLALIGGAGSGKSTLLAYLAANLAAGALAGQAPPFRLPDKRRSLVPLLVPLRYYREYLDLCQASPGERLKGIHAGKLADFVPWYLRQRSQRLEASQDFFDRLLLGKGCLLMLDGLDEITSQAERGRVRQQVEDLADDVYPGNRFLVTARESGYQESAVFSDDFTRLDVQLLDDDQIRALIANWCRALYPAEEEQRTQELVQAVGEINARRAASALAPLVSTPLMVSMVVSVKWGEAELPRERAKLYEAAVRVILQAQYIPDDLARKELVDWGGDWGEQREWLASLALAMHGGGQAGAAFEEHQVRAALAPLLPPEQLARFLQAVQLRGGLFEEKAGLYQFIHLTFQEFLCARLLAKRRDLDGAGLQERLLDPWWRETLLLIYGFAQADYAPFARQYLDWLSQRPGEYRLPGRELAGAALLELEKPQAEQRQAQARLLAQALEDVHSPASAEMRVRAGRTLNALGDARFRPDRFFLPDDPLLGLIEIPAGPFLMGSDPKRDENAKDGEQPQHTPDLPAFWISRYPTTTAQFRAFVQASGYEPADARSLRGDDNCPVVHVTWHDAQAYCRWLDGELRALAPAMLLDAPPAERSFWQGLASGKLKMGLPSEAQWEKAARGVDGRIYPWGDKFDPNLANMGDTGIGTTSAVGCFPGGVSPYGALDMAGNVLEWTRSLYEGYPYHPEDGREDLGGKGDRVLRGGAWGDFEYYVRSSFRVRSGPSDGNDCIGFRCARSP